MGKLFITMPAYNEADNLQEVVQGWHTVCTELNKQGVDANLVVANDGSKDNTWEVLLELQQQYPRLVPISKTNSGHGATLMFLYKYAIDNKCDWVFQTDSDGQTLPDEFWQMWENRDKAAFHIGVRSKRQDGRSRILVTRTLRFAVWLTFGVWVKDANTPFRLMRSDRLSEIMNMIPQDYFLANVAISALAIRRNESVEWYPVTFRPRQGGVNSINMKRIVKIGIEAVCSFPKIRRMSR